MPSLALSATQQRRLEKLARDTGRTPQAMLRFVLRDGFELCELEVNESMPAERIENQSDSQHEKTERPQRFADGITHGSL